MARRRRGRTVKAVRQARDASLPAWLKWGTKERLECPGQLTLPEPGPDDGGTENEDGQDAA